MSRATDLIGIMEYFVSSKVHVESIFDTTTVNAIKNTLMDGSKRTTTVKEFGEFIARELSKLPHFLHNEIDFSTAASGPKSSLFEEAETDRKTLKITVFVNTKFPYDAWKEAQGDGFKEELKQLRGTVRHELSHRMDFQRATRGPIKFLNNYRSKRLLLQRKGSPEYYGMPTEIMAHANQTVELINAGHEAAWKKTLALFAVSDTSRRHLNTKKYISATVKLMREYDVPWILRLKFKRELKKLARSMRINVENLGIDDPEDVKGTALRYHKPELANVVRKRK